MRFLSQTNKMFYSEKDVYSQLGIKVSKRSLKEYFDDQFTGIDMVRADVLRAHILSYISTKYGDVDINDKKIVNELSILMANGNLLTPEEVSASIGFKPYDTNPVCEFYGRMLA